MRPAFAQPAVPDWLSIACDAFVGSTNYFDNSIRYDIKQDIRLFPSVHPAGWITLALSAAMMRPRGIATMSIWPKVARTMARTKAQATVRMIARGGAGAGVSMISSAAERNWRSSGARWMLSWSC